jgi:hypothetical protein
MSLLGAIPTTTPVAYRNVACHCYGITVAYNMSVRFMCYGSTSAHLPTIEQWRATFLYATATATTVAYSSYIRLNYVALYQKVL